VKLIKKATVINYQSHKFAELNFHKGINAIIGSSDSGKTALLRSLFWAITNRPRGKNFVSYWDRNKSGDPKTETSVEIELENDVTVKRILSKDFSGYELNFNNSKLSEKFEALKGDVPEDIELCFNLSEGNIQKQMDKPFLLDVSAGEVARFFNKTISLDLVDRSLSAAESSKRSIKKDLLGATNQVELLEKQASEFEWIESANKLLSKAEKLDERVNKTENSISNIENVLEKISDSNKSIFEIGNLKSADELVKFAEQEYKSIKDIKNKEQKLNDLMMSIISMNAIMKEIPDFSDGKLEALIYDAKKSEFESDELEERIATVGKAIDDITASKEILETSEKLIGKYQEDLPESCPLCGGKI
jgi:DNA repair exonuclease SbcCD ATPase subunit